MAPPRSICRGPRPRAACRAPSPRRRRSATEQPFCDATRSSRIAISQPRALNEASTERLRRGCETRSSPLTVYHERRNRRQRARPSSSNDLGAALLSAATAAPHQQRGLIVNGGEAEAFDHTYTVALLYPNKPRSRTPTTPHASARTLVAPDVVVTAAHCFLDKKSDTGFDLGDEYEWRVALHRHDLTEDDDEHPECSAIIGVKRVVIHPRYDTDYDSNDVAVLLLSSPRRAPAAPPCSRRCRSRATTTRGTRRWARRWRWRGGARRSRRRTAARAT